MSAPLSRAPTGSDLAPVDGLMHQDADAYRNAKAAGPPVANQTLDMRRATEIEQEQIAKAQRRAEFAAATRHYRRQLNKMTRFTIHPHTKFLQRWDVLTMVALFFTASVTPFEVGFLKGDSRAVLLQGDIGHIVLFWVNRTVDTYFICDIVLNFFISYRSDAKDGGQWVFDNLKIAKRYASTWFPVDFVTAIPVDVILVVLEMQGIEARGDGSTLVRLVRMLRLVKLVRIVRASRIFKRWEQVLFVATRLVQLEHATLPYLHSPAPSPVSTSRSRTR